MSGGWLRLALALVAAYVCGSIPSAYLAGKSRGVDLRTAGSGNLGATNVVRVLGAKLGALVFLVDVLKGFLAVMFLPSLFGIAPTPLLGLLIGVAAIAGHSRPVFLGWQRGGKGVATAAGVFLALAWLPTLVAFVVWGLVFAISRYVSLASLGAAIALPIAFAATGTQMTDPVFIGAVVVTCFVFFTHRANIGRLRRGEEHRFIRRASDQPRSAA